MDTERIGNGAAAREEPRLDLPRYPHHEVLVRERKIAGSTEHYY